MVDKKQVLIHYPLPAVAVIELHRAEKRNALSIQMMQEFLQLLQEIHKKQEIRVLLIEGAGKSFCSGLDLNEAADLNLAEESANSLTALFREIYLSPLVTIASVQGHAVAGGAGLAALCDYVVAAENAQFGFPEVHRGLVPSIVLTFLLPQLGERALRELFLFGEMITAERACEYGLINQAVPLAQLKDVALAMAKRALDGAPGTIAHIKKLIRLYRYSELDDALQQALSIHKLSRTHVEAQEGIRAHLAGHKPPWAPR